MKTMIKSGIDRDLSNGESSLALAIAVLRERISSLPRADRADFYALLPYLLDGDDGERHSALATVREILGQEKGTVSRADLDAPPSASLREWMNDVGQRLHAARKAAGWTQEELAEGSGIPQSYISRLERGEHSPTSMTLEKLANALGVMVSELDPSDE